MNSSQLLSFVTFAYGFAATFYVASWVFKKTMPAKLAKWVAIIGLIANTAGFILRWKESYAIGYGHAPLSNMYESLVFFALTIGIIYLFIEMRYKTPLVGAFATPIAFLAMAYASLSPNISDKIQPLIPALKSNWLIAHVVTCFFGYAAFAVAFGVSIMYLIKNRAPDEKNGLLARLPGLNVLDELTHQMVMFGFSVPFHRHHHRCGVGQLGLGNLLVMGPQGDLVPDHLVCLCHAAARPHDAGVVREKDSLSVHSGVRRRALHLFRCQLSARAAQLRVGIAGHFPGSTRIKWLKFVYTVNCADNR